MSITNPVWTRNVLRAYYQVEMSHPSFVTTSPVEGSFFRYTGLLEQRTDLCTTAVLVLQVQMQQFVSEVYRISIQDFLVFFSPSEITWSKSVNKLSNWSFTFKTRFVLKQREPKPIEEAIYFILRDQSELYKPLPDETKCI